MSGGPVLGVDIGGVLVNRAYHDTDTSFFGDRPMDTPAVPGCFDGLRRLAEVFESRVHILSKAGPRVEALSLEWLQLNGVFDYVPRGNVWFVRKRHEKAPICEELGVTHFIDDRLDVLQHLTTVQHRVWFTGGTSEAAGDKPGWTERVDTWDRVVRHIETTLRRAGAHPDTPR